MSHLMLARSQMAFSLGFHIIFASISMVMPLLMTLAYRRYLRHGDPEDLRLTKAWMRGTAILFAVGAVSGTALSFQLGLLWPGFMEHAGPIIGMPFSLEGAAFFLEAIFLGLFLYGWDRLTPRVHLLCAALVSVFGFLSGALVIAANGWMNAPSGFRWVDGRAVDIDPWAAMFNAAWPLQAVHMLVAALQAVTLAGAGLHALGLLRGRAPGFHRRALGILLPLFAASSLVQPLIGDLSGKSVAKRQPEKLAAMEAHWTTERAAPLLVGGWPDEETETVRYGLHIPYGLSVLAHGDPHAEVTGLDAFPHDERPPVLVTHLAFQVMVGIGTLLAGLGAVILWARWRKKDLTARRGWLKLLVALTPLGFVALEAGWIVTEVGRQPWILYRVLRTADAVTPVPGLGWSFALIVTLYLTLGALAMFLLGRWFVIESERGDA
ncbi:MAG TPA: cytochrome ubiquinol oxidase subunit I [Candidatus Krumholzibacteria bacterium]|nr:cytochrome ubiquinol oxidase subunit I [Candidatus Krumholzibacteria bacterium]